MFKKILSVILVLILAVVTYIYIDNNSVAVTSYTISSPKLDKDFDNYKIALLTDFHDSDNFTKIIKKTQQLSPKIILIAGDAINMNDSFCGNLLWLLDGIRDIAPIYFVSGNDEVWSMNQDEVLNEIHERGVTILNNKAIELKYQNGSINLIGYQDIVYDDHVMRMKTLEKSISELYDKVENKDKFSLLMFHRANYFDTVAKYPFDLVVSGHTHGGQINLPYIRDKILIKHMGSAKYCKGLYQINGRQMVVSGGLEKSYRSPRIFNPPEIVSITLKRAG